MSKKQEKRLAIYGGKRIRNKSMPVRSAFGRAELEAVKKVFDYYRYLGRDFGYQGKFEKLYTDAFVRYMGGIGFADAVSSGTAALYIAIASLQLKPNSHVLVSPITDPGTISAIILNRLTPVLADTMPDSCNTGIEEIMARFSSKIKAVLIVHLAGKAAPVDKIAAFVGRKNIPLIEDCSQAHGARIGNKKVGTFGDIAAFSTMYRKSHATGGCGGIVFTKSKRLYELIRAYADRGKPFLKKNFNEKDPGSFLFPALNLNIDELSCAIGIKSLVKLEAIRKRRIRFLQYLNKMLNKYSKVCHMLEFSTSDSPFFQPIFVDKRKIFCTKAQFAQAVKAEGIDLNPNYKYVVCEWQWAKAYLGDNFVCQNAINYRNDTFNLLLNENYGKNEAEDILAAILKVEQSCLK